MPNISIRLCKEVAENPPADRKEVWDSEIKGFGIRPAGQGRLAFILQYRVKGDPKARRLTLGHWPESKPDRIREEARAIKTAAQLGQDLVAERASSAPVRVAPRVAPLLDRWRATTEAEIATKAARGESVLYERELLRLEAKVSSRTLGYVALGLLMTGCGLPLEQRSRPLSAGSIPFPIEQVSSCLSDNGVPLTVAEGTARAEGGGSVMFLQRGKDPTKTRYQAWVAGTHLNRNGEGWTMWREAIRDCFPPNSYRGLLFDFRQDV